MVRILLSGGDWQDDVMKPPQSTLDIPNYNSAMVNVERHFLYVSGGAVVTYLILIAIAYHHQRINSNEEEEEEGGSGDYCEAAIVLTLSSTEQSAAFLAFVCLLVTLILQVLPMFVYNNNNAAHHAPLSAVVVAAVMVQSVAMTTNALMAFAPHVPILVDPVTGGRVHLLRWCEWAPLAFVMTFLVEGSDVPDARCVVHNSIYIFVHSFGYCISSLQLTHSLMPYLFSWGLKLAYATATSQGLSTICGLIFPFCTGIISWMVVMTFSVSQFGFLFVRLRYKEARFRLIRQGKRLDEMEIYIRSHIALRLLRTCAVGWSFLVTMYFTFSVAVPLLAPDRSMLQNPAVPMISEAFCDVVLKFFYMSYIVTMHTQVFDEGARSKRRLEELRQMMWDNSSDVLAISVKSLSGNVMTMVSPTFFRLLRNSDDEDKGKNKKSVGGMIFELSKADMESLMVLSERTTDGSMPNVRPKLYNFDFGGLTPQNMKEKVLGSQDVSQLIGADAMQALAALVGRSWRCEARDTLMSHDLVFRTEADDNETIKCEAKVTRLEESALFVVLRDISERFRRFEAEKLAATEITARRKDQEANRFTRHEVKNGLLSAMGLCDSLAEIASKGAAGTSTLEKMAVDLNLGQEQRAVISKLSLVHTDISRLLGAMDSSLHEVLDTVLAEAMARDVIHGAYDPQLEPLDVAALVRGISGRAEGADERFPVTTSPEKFPILLFDQQLLKCIHRNAVSNACKYGTKGGTVKTFLRYDFHEKILQMDVTNEPGDNHEDMLKLISSDGAERVFEPGSRLHSEFETGPKHSNTTGHHSAGDGAWIMRKCTQTLGGSCSIDFREHYTVFSLRCPAALFIEKSRDGDSDTAPSMFKFPKGTWGIAIDDSKMQRKLLNRFLEFAGIQKSRIKILGETNEEMLGFNDFVVSFIEEHPDDWFLLIVDENLDLAVESARSLKHSTLSGSSMVQDIRHRLLPEQERQMLALIRSANDSSHDVAIYNSRAHGFVPKAPVKKDAVRKLLEPLWEKRFSCLDDFDSVSDFSPSMGSLTELDFSDSDGPDKFFLVEQIRAIDRIVEEDDNGDSAEKWPVIWEKLHAFKGDLLTLFDSDEVDEIAERITNMRGLSLPVDFSSKWSELRRVATMLLEHSADESILSPKRRNSGIALERHPKALIEDIPY